MSVRSSKINLVYQFLLQIIKAENSDIGDKLPTEVELANRFEVSRPTVTKAVNLLIEEDMVYKRPGMGTFIKQKTSSSNGEYVFGLVFPLIGKGEIFRPITEAIADLSEKLNFSLVWGGQFSQSKMNSTQMDQMVDFYLQNRVDGILMAPMELSSECMSINKNIVDKIISAGIPLVLVDGDFLEFPERSNFDLVGIDNFRAGYVMTNHYLEQGAKRIDFLKLPYSAQTIPQRIMGYQQSLVNAGISPSLNWVHSSEMGNDQDIQKMIDSGARNIICSNDDVAIQLIKTLSELNLKVPEDVRVIGFDDQVFARYPGISLTTVAQPCQKIGNLVVQVLLERIKSPDLPPRMVNVNFEYKIRQSSIIPKNK